MSENITAEEMKLLIDKNIIKVGTIVQIRNNNYVDYAIQKILYSDNQYIFYLKNLDTLVESIVKQEYITGIEHMNLKRFIEAYSVDDEISTINILKRTNVGKSVINKKEAVLNGIKLTNGIKIILHHDSNIRMNNKPLTVKGVGDSIKLVAPRGRPKKNA